MNYIFEKKYLLKDFLLAVYMCIPAINAILISFFPSLSGKIMAGLYLLIAIMFSIIWGVEKNFRLIVNKRNVYLFAIPFYICVVYTISYFSKVTNLSLVEFVVYPLLPLVLISKIDFDYRRVIQLCPCITVWGILNINDIFVTNNNTISMGLSYAFLPPIIFSIVYLITDRRSKATVVFSILHVFYLFQILQYGSRGPLLSIMVCIIVLWITQKKNSGVKLFWVRVFVISIVFFLVAFFFVDIISFLNNWFIAHGIRIQSFNKTLLLNKVENIDNGRSGLQKMVFEHFKNKPLFGHGISSFSHYTSEDYPHSFILQSFFDMGIIGTVLIFSPVIHGYITIWKMQKEKLIFIVAISCASVIGALFSGDMWENALLWLSISLILKFRAETKVSNNESIDSYV